MPPLRLLALLQKLQGALPQELDTVPSQPSNRRGLIGGGYRAYMAGLGDRAAMPAAKAFGAAGPSRQRNVQFATGGACTTCHSGEPPPPLPNISLPPSPPVPPLPPFGVGGTLLPPPLGGLATAGWLADILSGPQKSEYAPPRGPPPAGPESGRRRPKQCDVQHDLDEEICDSLPFGAVKRREKCWRSQKARHSYCISSGGEVGFPPLKTR
jgi:hypothetical protein